MNVQESTRFWRNWFKKKKQSKTPNRTQEDLIKNPKNKVPNKYNDIKDEYENMKKWCDVIG